MSSFLPHLHTDLRRTLLTKRGATQDPAQVPTGLHKEYSRMERVQLPEPARLDYPLQQAIEKRRSTNATGPSKPLSLKDIGTLLGSALRRHKEPSTRRNYPSGGALYPVETYVIAKNIDTIHSGVFHYNPSAHAIEKLWALPADFDMEQIVSMSESLEVSALIVFTSVWERSSAKYGDLSYLHALLEAGHMSQNILLLSTALELETRPYAGFSDTKILTLLDLDEELEQPIHSITISKSEV